MAKPLKKLIVYQAVVVEGRDDVDKVSRACDALIIPTHGFGITAETWSVIDKAYKEKGLIILTDPDYSGEEIRRKLTERFPDAIQAYVQREDALAGGDIGIENSSEEKISEAIVKALANAQRLEKSEEMARTKVSMDDLVRLGLAGSEGSSALRSKVCGQLGIGFGNAKAMLKKLEGFEIGKEELEEAIKEIKK